MESLATQLALAQLQLLDFGRVRDGQARCLPDNVLWCGPAPFPSPRLAAAAMLQRMVTRWVGWGCGIVGKGRGLVHGLLCLLRLFAGKKGRACVPQAGLLCTRTSPRARQPPSSPLSQACGPAVSPAPLSLRALRCPPRRRLGGLQQGLPQVFGRAILLAYAPADRGLAAESVALFLHLYCGFDLEQAAKASSAPAPDHFLGRGAVWSGAGA